MKSVKAFAHRTGNCSFGVNSPFLTRKGMLSTPGVAKANEMVKIVHEREKCIGCGACASICPSNWEMADDGKSKCKNKNPKTAGCNNEAANACPVKCIKVQ